MSHQKHQACIEECVRCAQECEHCAEACLGEADVKRMAECIRLDRDCAALCWTAAALMSRVAVRRFRLLAVRRGVRCLRRGVRQERGWPLPAVRRSLPQDGRRVRTATLSGETTMILFGHSGEGLGWGGPIQPWELHPASVHLPIAFLLGGVALDIYAWVRARTDLAQFATGLLIAGVLTGVIAMLTGLLAFLTVPAHTEKAHRLMYWHLGVLAASLLLFAWPAWTRWQGWGTPSPTGRLVPCLAAVLMLVGAGIGGFMVYHGGAGVDPALLRPELRKGHQAEDAPAGHDAGH